MTPDFTATTYQALRDLPHLEIPINADLIDLGEVISQIPPGKVVDELRWIASWMKDGARIIARVPDFDTACRLYESGDGDVDALVMQGGTAKTLWNAQKLSTTLNLAGFEIIGSVSPDGKWVGPSCMIEVIAKKCMRPAWSKPMRDIECVMSMPRLCWTENCTAVSEMGFALGINVLRVTGVFWGQCNDRAFSQIVSDGRAKYVLTIDYDTVFDPEDVIRLWQVMESEPSVDAIFPLQIQRDKENLLVTIKQPDGSLLSKVDATFFHKDVIDVSTGHFGLSLIRTESLRRLPRPWFKSVPNESGEWNEGRTDEDIWFWKQMQNAGMRVCLCPKVRIGHIQTIVTWPGQDMKTIHQYLSKYNADGRPAECRTF